MTFRVQVLRGITAVVDAFVGRAGELQVDLTKKELRVHDGITVGGHALARANFANTAAATGSNAGHMSAQQATDLINAAQNILSEYRRTHESNQVAIPPGVSLYTLLVDDADYGFIHFNSSFDQNVTVIVPNVEHRFIARNGSMTHNLILKTLDQDTGLTVRPQDKRQLITHFSDTGEWTLVSEINTTLQGLYNVMFPISSVQFFNANTNPNTINIFGIVATWTQLGLGFNNLYVNITDDIGEIGHGQGTELLFSSVNGNHAHGGATAGGGDHNHAFSGVTSSENKTATFRGGIEPTVSQSPHEHNFAGATGQSGNHVHGIFADGNHQHTIDMASGQKPVCVRLQAWIRTS